MLKKVIIIISIIIITVCCLSLLIVKKTAVPNDIISIEGDMMEYGYYELKDEADIILLVKCVDNLSHKKSIFYYDEGLMYGFASNRDIEVIDVLKGENKDKRLSILEPTAITEDGKELHLEDYNPMKNGCTYIVFLSKETANGCYSIISGNNGKIDIGKNNSIDYELICNNEFSNIAFSAMIDYYSDITESYKESIINSGSSHETIKCSIMNKDIFMMYDGKEISIVE